MSIQHPNPPTLAARMALQKRPTAERQVMVQKWRELLFLHWAIEPEAIQRTLPPGLQVDTYNGQAWLGIVPFYMRGIRPRYLPAVPGISNFLEVNLRTYVYAADGTPGVWFYSLDANQWLAVRIARRFFYLPYFDASMRAPRFPVAVETPINYRSHRRSAPDSTASHFTYRGGATLGPAEPGSFEFFLIERYILFAYDHQRQRLFSGRVYHRPYELCEVAVDSYDHHLAALAGFDLGDRPAEHIAMSHGVDVDVYGVKEIKPS